MGKKIFTEVKMKNDGFRGNKEERQARNSERFQRRSDQGSGPNERDDQDT